MLIFIGILLLFSNLSGGAPGKLKKRFSFSLKPEMYFDSNVFETRFKVESDFGKQLWAHAKYDYKKGKYSGKIRWTGLFNSYNSSISDNRFANVLQGQVYKRISKNFFLGNLFIYRNKAWFNRGIIHKNFHFTLFMGYREINLTITVGEYFYGDFRNKDTGYINIDISRERKMSKVYRILYGLESSRFTIGHASLGYLFSRDYSSPESIWLNSLKPRIGLQFQGLFRGKIITSCDIRRSKSRLYKSYAPSLDFNLNIRKGNLLFACNLIYQKKYYARFSGKDSIITPDPEETSMRGFVLAADYDFCSFSGLSVKWIKIKGETIYRGIYYSKSIFTAGIRFRF